MRGLFLLLALAAGTANASPGAATQYMCRSKQVLGLVYQSNTPCPGATIIDITGPYGNWLKIDKTHQALINAHYAPAHKPGTSQARTAEKIANILNGRREH